MSALSRFSLLAAIALCASAAHAVGLGPVELRSYLNEPLRADIVLRDVPADRLQRLSASIASQRAYEELGLARNDYLRNVSATLGMEDGNPVVRLRGERPLQEPLLELLVVVREGRQMVQRSYTLLIDPPQFAQQPQQGDPPPAPAPAAPQPKPGAAAEGAPRRANAPTDAARAERSRQADAENTPSQTAPASTVPTESAGTASPPAEGAPESIAAEPASPDRGDAALADNRRAETAGTETVEDQQSAPAAARSPREEAPAFFTTESERELDPELLAEIGQGPSATASNRAATASSAPPSSTAGVYPVRRGETLWRVASNTRPPGAGISMQQMMLAIVENNPGAFENGDARQLRAGARLRIPDAASVRAIDQSRALRQMKAMLEGGQSIESASTVPAQVAEANESETVAEQQSEVVARPDAPGADGEASKDAVTTAEGAAEQTPAPKEGGPEDASQGEGVESTPSTVDAADETTDVVAAEDGIGGEADADAAVAQGDVSPDADGVVGDGDGGTGDDTASSQPAEGTQAETAERQAAAGTQDATASEQAPAVAEAQTPAAESSRPVSAPGTWFGLPWYLLLVAAGVVLLGTAAIIETRRRAARRAAAQAEQEPTTVSLTSASTAAAAQAASVDEEAPSEAASVEEAEGAAPGDDALGETGGDEDPLADADFRIAYGMYDDAAERLTDAISRDPENAALRLKLAEVHCAAGDRERFLDAADAAARTGLSADEERELADMAGRIAPDSRFATAIGASMAAGAMLGQEDSEAATDPDVSGGHEDVEAASVSETSFEDALEGANRSDDADSDGLFDEDAAGETSDRGADIDGLHSDQDAAAEALTEPTTPAETGADELSEQDSADNVLEFDLEGLEFGDAPTQSAASSSEPTDPAAGNADDHALDFDLDSLDLSEDATASPVSAAASDEASAGDENAIDFDWELPEEEGDTAEPQPGVDNLTGVERDASDPSNNAVGPDAFAEGTVAPSSDKPLDGDPIAVADADGFDLDDFSLEDFDLDGSSEPAATEPQPDAGQDAPMLELPEHEPSSPTETGDADAFAVDDFEIDPDAGPADNEGSADQGLAGQLDLARAYVDMGEGEMARPLLETVVQGGDATQRAEAQRLLDIVG